MRGVVVTKVGSEREKKDNLASILKEFLYKPFLSGIFGYIGFFTLLIISKYLGYLIGNRVSLQIDHTDLFLSLMGFAFIFVLKLKENIKGKAL